MSQVSVSGPSIPSGYLIRSLGEDGTFYSPSDVRPPGIVPSIAQRGDAGGPAEHAAVLNQLGELKKEIRQVSVRMIDELSPLTDHAESYDQVFSLTNAYGHFKTFVNVLNKLSQAAANQASRARGSSNRLQSRAERLQNLQCILQEHEASHSYVFRETLNYLEGKATHPDHVVAIANLAASQRACLNQIQDAGATCRKKATLLGLTRLPPDVIAGLTDRPLVESERLVELGKLHDVLVDADSEDEAQYINLEGKGFCRISAPPSEGQKHSTAIIFWEKDDDEDNTPTENKIIGAVVYSPHLISKGFSPDQAYSQAEAAIDQEFLLDKANVDRQRLFNRSKMAKGRGAQSIYGMPYTMKLPEHQEFYDGNVRIPLEAGEAFMEARHESFLRGFLPEFAASREAAARKANLINKLGYPSTSTFVTYGYAASAHTDKDACPTSGWVTSRPSSLHRFTSNFAWVSHGVLVELASNAFWFWDARKHEHGTTVNEVLLTEPELTYSKGYIKRNVDRAQWTRVSVLSEAVCKAHSR